MRKFLKDIIPITLFFYSQVLLLILTAQLASLNHQHSLGVGTIFYMLFAPTFFYIIFIILRYIKLRVYYQLSPDTNHLDQSALLPSAPTLLIGQLKDLYEQQYHHYQTELENLRLKQQQHIDFIQQWVHQMKTPISVMHLSLQKEAEQLPYDFYRDMEEEREKLQRGLELALYHARIDKFNRDFHIKKVNLKLLVLETIQDFKIAFIRNQVYPEVIIDEQLQIDTDPKWFQFVLGQITSNAIKYAKGSKEKIKYKVHKENQLIHLFIKDEGIGIQAKDITRVFDPFFTGENGRKFQESTGMGLYLSKQICDAIGHNIKIDSQPQNGTTITITF